MNTPEEKKAWPPRGYVDRDRWLWINENCDPGDAARDCPVHFIPHNTFQLPSLIPMMSVAEHEATVSELKERVGKLQRALSFAASTIRSGEEWSDQCEVIIGEALTTEKEKK